MKFIKKNKLLVISSLLITLLFSSVTIGAQETDFELKSKSAILMDFKSGRVIYQKNPTEKLPPASITKIMTMILVMEALDEGRANLNDTVMVSERAANMGGSQIWLEAGEQMKLENLLKAVAIVSANDACLALAEYLHGTEEEFLEKMNQKAKSLGLENTKFYNTNGLPINDQTNKENYTTAYDVALMTRELLKYPQILKYTSVWIDHLREGESFLRNTNELVRFYDGVDGLKTGYTSQAGFCLAATAKRKGMRFISVIMKAPNSETRFNESKNLLSYAFNIHKSLAITKAGEVIDELEVFKGKKDKVTVVAQNKLAVSVLKGEEEKLTKRIILDQQLVAPIKSGAKLGKIIVAKNDEKLGEVSLVAKNDIEKDNVFGIIFKLLSSFITKFVT
ncbi:MAG: D-alanyl-D-alanine carboxypeptidase family protein, partial [Bacillota bacterium]